MNSLHHQETPPPQRIGRYTVGNILSTAAIRFGDREAFYCSDTDRRFSFRQADERSNRLANGLASLGLKKGDVVALLSSNRIEFVDTWFALAKSGLIGISLNYRLAPVELSELMRSVNARALLCEEQFETLAAGVRNDVPSLSHFIVFGGSPANGDREERGAELSYEELLASSSPVEPMVEIQEHDTFCFNLTSGTSNLPKCYAITHYNATVGNLFQALSMSASDTFLTVFPMYGRVGYAWTASGLMCGARNILASFDAAKVPKLIETEQITVVNFVPTMAAMLLENAEANRVNFASLRAFVFAGSPLPAPIVEHVKARFCVPIYEFYGMQESGALTVSTPGDRERRPDSVGRRIMHVDLRVVDECGCPLPHGEVGEVVCRSPAGVNGYLDNPARSAETFRNGWLYTGDLGMIDEEGYLFIRGRKKDVIVSGGQNVFAAEVEEAILFASGVLECAVIGLPDEIWGEKVTAIVVPRQGSDLSPEYLVRHCRERLAGFKTPKEILVRSTPLPRTTNGKVQKFLLIEQLTNSSEPASRD